MSPHRQPTSSSSPTPQSPVRQRMQRAATALCGVALLACLQACGGGQTETDAASANGPTAADLQRQWVDHGDHQHLVHPKKGQP